MSTPIDTSKLNNQARNLLLYFETACTDYGGKFDNIRTNSGDFAIASRWKQSNFIDFGRLPSGYVFNTKKTKSPKNASHWVTLSEEAWITAHKLRRERYARLRKRVDAIFEEC